MPQKELLKASVPDVRPFTTLLRGVNFSNRATMTINSSGMMINVEEGRTLLGSVVISSAIFDEFEYNPEADGSLQSQNSQENGPPQSALELPLSTLLECLNIFGTAVGAPSKSAGLRRKWRRADGGSDNEDEGDGGDGEQEEPARVPRGRPAQAQAANGRIDNYFPVAGGKRTGMRLTYIGEGHPLTLLLAEDAAGPTTTCEIATYDPEPLLEIPFDRDRIVLKFMLKSSWLRDAFSELDPSCDKLAFIGVPAGEAPTARRPKSQPMFRIKANGAFGSAEMDYPNDREVLENFECTERVSFTYRFSYISRTLRVLQGSTRTHLRIDDEGVLSLQFLTPSANPLGQGMVESVTEFRCLPQDESDV